MEGLVENSPVASANMRFDKHNMLSEAINEFIAEITNEIELPQ